jgi:hypothetical protein
VVLLVFQGPAHHGEDWTTTSLDVMEDPSGTTIIKDMTYIEVSTTTARKEIHCIWFACVQPFPALTIVLKAWRQVFECSLY